MFNRMMMAGMLLIALMSGGSMAEIRAQDTAKTMLAAAGRELKTIVGKKGEARAVVLKSARGIYEQISSRWPDDSAAVAQAHLQMALLSQQLGDSQESLRQLQLVLAIEGETRKHAVAYIEMSKLARKSKQPEVAIKSLQALLNNCAECRRKCTDALLRMSSIQAAAERFDAAAVSAQQVIDKYPEAWRANVDACNQVCRILIQRREWVKAIAYLAQVDKLLEERFASSDSWDSVRSAMERMSARRTLTPWSPNSESVPAS